jgi:hypothetical protein
MHWDLPGFSWLSKSSLSVSLAKGVQHSRSVNIHISAPTQLPVLLRSIAFHRPKRPQLRLEWHQPEDVPKVDIIITCCGEDLDVLLDTVRATCNIDYPPERFRVFLSDDGASEELRAAIESLEIIGPKLIYTTREKPAVKDYKAGNLNHGLKFSRALPNQTWRVGIPRSEESPGSSSPPSKKSSAATLVGSETDEMPKPIAKPMSPSVYSSSVYEGMMGGRGVVSGEGRWWEGSTQSWRISGISAICAEGPSEPSKESSAAVMVDSDADEMPTPMTNALPFTFHELEDTSVLLQVSEYIVGIDADMIPERCILRALLPHMVNDATMAIACPPQVCSLQYRSCLITTDSYYHRPSTTALPMTP